MLILLRLLQNNVHVSHVTFPTVFTRDIWDSPSFIKYEETGLETRKFNIIMNFDLVYHKDLVYELNQTCATMWLQASLPIKHGGLGIRSAVHIDL